ncbi:ATP-binding protein [Mycobacterium sp. 3519A]|uniref:ATP-binding protein n=1 Tax=Mycobacterium sp. 3519A TaxID=2057184 RepID=UPI001159B907|nr:ATP-binding protein [Mycobacterium sp. 3519A]
MDPQLLQSLFLFEALPTEHLRLVAANSVVIDYAPGLIFAEGDPACYFYVLVAGELVLSKRAGEHDVETSRTAHRGAYCGATASFIDNPPERYTFSVRASQQTSLLRIDADFFGRFVRAQYPMAVHLLQGMIVDHEGVHQILGQQHRMQAAATLTAGLMHGLNNPAGAIRRIAAQLRTSHETADLDHTNGALSPKAKKVLDRLRHESRVRLQAAQPRSSLQMADDEDQIGDWLSCRRVEQAWDVAPILATAGLDIGVLNDAAQALEQGDASAEIGTVVTAVAVEVERLLLVDELASASREVTALVESAQQYSQLDSTPLVQADVHELLDSTLTVMSAVIGEGIAVKRDYARNLPVLMCYAAELNQAWTNIVHNAVDAIRATDAKQGVVTIKTSQTRRGVIRVQICDNGIGILPEVRDRIFLPFFSTKPVGQGVGMGLDLAWRVIVGKHRGTLGAVSGPGDTRITACLPVHGAESRE